MANRPVFNVLAEYWDDSVLNANFQWSEDGRTIIQLVVNHESESPGSLADFQTQKSISTNGLASLQNRTSESVTGLTTEDRSQCSLTGSLTKRPQLAISPGTFDDTFAASTKSQNPASDGLILFGAQPTDTAVLRMSERSGLVSSADSPTAKVSVLKKRPITSLYEALLHGDSKKSRTADDPSLNDAMSDGETAKTSFTQKELRGEIALAISNGQSDLKRFQNMAGSKRYKENPTKFTFQGRLRKEFRVGGPKSTAPKSRTKVRATQTRSDSEVLRMYLEVGIHKRAKIEPTVFDWRGDFRQSYKDTMLTKWRQAQELSKDDLVAMYHILDIDKRIELAPGEFNTEGELISMLPRHCIFSKNTVKPQTRSQPETDNFFFPKHDDDKFEGQNSIIATFPKVLTVFSADVTGHIQQVDSFEDFANMGDSDTESLVAPEDLNDYADGVRADLIAEDSSTEDSADDDNETSSDATKILPSISNKEPSKIKENQARKEILEAAKTNAELVGFELMNGHERNRKAPRLFTVKGRLREEYRSERLSREKHNTVKIVQDFAAQKASDEDVLHIYLSKTIDERFSLEPSVFDTSGNFRPEYRSKMLNGWKSKTKLSDTDHLTAFHVLSKRQRYELAPDVFKENGKFQIKRPRLIALAEKLPIPDVMLLQREPWHGRNQKLRAQLPVDGIEVFCGAYALHSPQAMSEVMIGLTRSSGGPPIYGYHGMFQRAQRAVDGYSELIKLKNPVKIAIARHSVSSRLGLWKDLKQHEDHRSVTELADILDATRDGRKVYLVVVGLDGFTTRVANLLKMQQRWSRLEITMVISVAENFPGSASSFPRHDNGVRYGSFPLKDFTRSNEMIPEALQELLKIFQKVNIGKQILAQRYNLQKYTVGRANFRVNPTTKSPSGVEDGLRMKDLEEELHEQRRSDLMRIQAEERRL